nr:hypothetical protein [Burkholderia singularis]
MPDITYLAAFDGMLAASRVEPRGNRAPEFAIDTADIVDPAAQQHVTRFSGELREWCVCHDDAALMVDDYDRQRDVLECVKVSQWRCAAASAVAIATRAQYYVQGEQCTGH